MTIADFWYYDSIQKFPKQISVMITFSDIAKENTYKKLFQFSVKKYIDDDDIFWKIDNIEY